MTNAEKERIIEKTKGSLRTQAQIILFGCGILNDFNFYANTYLKEQKDRPLSKQENSAKLFESLAGIAEAAKKLSAEFDNLSSEKLKELGSMTLANFEG